MIEFKLAETKDVDILVRLREEFAEHEPFSNPLDAAAKRAVVQNLIENENLGKIWLIQAGEKTAGYVVLTFGYSLEYAGRDALIDELYLRAEFRGQGIGQKTLEFIADFCRRANIAAVHLEVERDNTAAKNLYHKNGFVDHERYFLTKWIEVIE